VLKYKEGLLHNLYCMETLHWFTDPITKQYADFTGRASRQAFWMYMLFYIIGYVLLSFVADPLGMLYSLALLVPSIAIAARRLHDIDRSGWWQLIGIIPIVGWIIVIIWYARETGTESNRFGPATNTVAAQATASTDSVAAVVSTEPTEVTRTE
jgi:uncharacterized membrane protein YhaH (DUF805 family)